jgi:hypothetical protein
MYVQFQMPSRAGNVWTCILVVAAATVTAGLLIWPPDASGGAVGIGVSVGPM